MKYSPATPSRAQRAELRAPGPPAGARCRHVSSQTRREQGRGARGMQGARPGSGSRQLARLAWPCPGSWWRLGQLLTAPCWCLARVCPARLARLGHAQHTLCARQPCSSLPLPFYIPCQSLNLNEASRMVAPRQRLDERWAGIASGRAQGLSLPVCQGEGGKPSCGGALGSILGLGLGVLATWMQGGEDGWSNPW